ncbi:hypothetical protein AX15_005511 [Amanita polypyramis BW_CC]|nr:hypothetical protein AX15_005511 [Amanita polypyramis BW_CC]
MSTACLKESRMPFTVLIAGQVLAIVCAATAVIFIALVWIMPSYAIQPPTRVAVEPRRRRASVDTTISASPTMVESEIEQGELLTKGRELNGSLSASKLPKKKSQVFNKLSSSIVPVAKRLSVPTKKFSVSVATKISPHKMALDAQARYTAIITSVHNHFPRPLPHFKKSSPLITSSPRNTPVFASYSSAVKKLVTPVGDLDKRQRPRT